MITPNGGLILGQVRLNPSLNYVVTASVTATSEVNDAMQCQLLDSRSGGWRAMGEATLTARASVNLQHAFGRGISISNYVVSVGCISASQNYVVDSAKLYAMQVGSIGSGGGPVISRNAPALEWEQND